MAHSSPPSDCPATPTPQSFTFTFLNSMGGSVVTSNALFFLSKQGFHFSQAKNFLLGSLLGIAYIAGALGAKPVMSALRKLAPGLSSRSVLAGLMVICAVLCTIPQIAIWTGGPEGPGAWPVWVIVLLYSPVTGMLWPIVESYISGGRSAQTLRSTMGRWNVVWSSAGLAVTLAIAPFVEHYPGLCILAISVAHLAALLPLAGFAPEPGAHLEGEHEPHPPVYADLLVTFRLLVPLAYLVMSALGAYLPSLAERLGVLAPREALGVRISVGALLPGAWVLSRVMTFWLLERWQGWHGRWFFATGSGVLLLVGFAGVVLAGLLPPVPGLAVTIAGLALFGAAVGAIYTAAIYYAMEVGKADVSAGSTHEALIGVGYTLGPGIGLAATLGVEYNLLQHNWFEGVMLGSVGVLALGTAAVVFRKWPTTSPKAERFRERNRTPAHPSDGNERDRRDPRPGFVEPRADASPISWVSTSSGPAQ